MYDLLRASTESWAAHSKDVTSIASSIEDVDAECAYLASRCRRCLAEVPSAVADEAASIRTSTLRHLDGVLSKTHDAHTALQSELQCAREGIESTVQAALVDVRPRSFVQSMPSLKCLLQSSSQSALTGAYVSASTSNLGNLVRDMDTYLSGEIKEDVPTGETPRRRSILQEAWDLDGPDTRRTLLRTLLDAQQTSDHFNPDVSPATASVPPLPSRMTATEASILASAEAVAVADAEVSAKSAMKGAPRGKSQATQRRGGVLRERTNSQLSSSPLVPASVKRPVLPRVTSASSLMVLPD